MSYLASVVHASASCLRSACLFCVFSLVRLHRAIPGLFSPFLIFALLCIMAMWTTAKFKCCIYMCASSFSNLTCLLLLLIVSPPPLKPSRVGHACFTRLRSYYTHQIEKSFVPVLTDGWVTFGWSLPLLSARGEARELPSASTLCFPPSNHS